MIKLIVKFCMVLNPYICLQPIEVVPADGDIASVTSCLMGGAIFTAKNSGVDWIGKVYCSQSPNDFQRWLKAQISK